MRSARRRFFERLLAAAERALAAQDLQRAEAAYRAALSHAEASAGGAPEPDAATRALHGLGRVQMRTGQLEAARRSYQRLIDLERAHFGDEDPRRATALVRLSDVERGLGSDPTAIEPLVEEIEHLLEALLDRDPGNTDGLELLRGVSLCLIGDLLAGFELLERAEKALARAIVYLKRTLEPNAELLAEARLRLSHVQATLAELRSPS